MFYVPLRNKLLQETKALLRLALTKRRKVYVTTIGSLATVLSLTANINFLKKFQKVQIKCEHFFVLR